MAKYLTQPVDSDQLPSGIPYIVGNEAAERFSFYGMKGILVIYMTQHLISLDGQKDVMTEEDAKGYYHLFTSSAYFFPVIGAIISDWFLGKYRTIMSLSIVYCIGHAALALGDTNLGAALGVSPRIWLAIGLSLIAMGSGGIKPCVSAHVGDQFGPKSQHMLSTVFGWFYFSINLGAFASTLLTPLLLKYFGPSVAFGVPGALMFLATFVFWLGRNKFVHVPPSGTKFLRETVSGTGLLAIYNLVVIYLFVMIFWSLFDQTGSAWVLQAKYMDREIFGWNMLPAQVQAANPIFVLALIPVFTYAVYPAIDRVFPLTPLRKIGIGFFLTVIAFAIPTWVESQINGGRIQSVSSDYDADDWPAENLLDGRAGGAPWISAAKTKYPQSIVVRLRERRSWKINEVRLHRDGEFRQVLADELKTGASDVGQQQIRSCWPREIEVQVSDKRDGPWISVARTSLTASETEQQARTIPLDEVTAEYVKLIVHSNHGGPLLSISEIEVIARSDDDSDTQPSLWNVAATGHRPSVLWQLLAYFVLTCAEVMVSITCLEFSYTQAPRKMKSLIMGLFLLSVSLGNLLTAAINFCASIVGLEGTNYYAFFTGMMLVTAIAFVFVARFYRGKSYIHGQDDDAEDGRFDKSKPVDK